MLGSRFLQRLNPRADSGLFLSGSLQPLAVVLNALKRVFALSLDPDDRLVRIFAKRSLQRLDLFGHFSHGLQQCLFFLSQLYQPRFMPGSFFFDGFLKRAFLLVDVADHLFALPVDPAQGLGKAALDLRHVVAQFLDALFGSVKLRHQPGVSLDLGEVVFGLLDAVLGVIKLLSGRLHFLRVEPQRVLLDLAADLFDLAASLGDLLLCFNSPLEQRAGLIDPP